MAIINPPAPLPLRRVQWRLKRPSQVNRSEWTGRRQAVVIPGAARWIVSGEFPPIVQAANAHKWRAFFAALDGQANVFPLRAVEKAQTAAANPTVNGGGQTGNVLNLAGVAGALGSMYLQAGMMLTVPLQDGSVQLVVLIAPITVAAGNTGVATFKAPLRSAPANGAVIEAQLPYALLALAGDTSGWDVDAGQLYGFAFEAEEAF